MCQKLDIKLYKKDYKLFLTGSNLFKISNKDTNAKRGTFCKLQERPQLYRFEVFFASRLA